MAASGSRQATSSCQSSFGASIASPRLLDRGCVPGIDEFTAIETRGRSDPNPRASLLVGVQAAVCRAERRYRACRLNNTMLKQAGAYRRFCRATGTAPAR